MTTQPRGPISDFLHVDDDDFDFFEHQPVKLMANVGLSNDTQIPELNQVTKSLNSVFDDDKQFGEYLETLSTTNANQQGKLIMNTQPHDIVITSEDVERLKASAESETHTLEGKQSVDELDKSFAIAEVAPINVSEVLDSFPNQATTDAINTPVEEGSFKTAEELFEALEDKELNKVADERKAQERIRVNLDDLHTDDTPTTDTKVVTLGARNPKYFGSTVANTLVNNASNQVEEPPKQITVKESNSQRKKRLAEEHNAKLNNNKVAIVKFRTFGLKMQIEILQVTNRQAQLSHERGNYAVYTTKSAVSTTRMDHLAYAQRMNRSTLSGPTLDWLLDQIGETNAFEVRSGRLRTATPLKYTIDKTKEEWIAKGFFVIDGEVKFAEGNFEQPN